MRRPDHFAGRRRLRTSTRSKIQDLQQLLPSLQRVDLDAGHTIHAENPTGFNRAVIAFMRSLA